VLHRSQVRSRGQRFTGVIRMCTRAFSVLSPARRFARFLSVVAQAQHVCAYELMTIRTIVEGFLGGLGLAGRRHFVAVSSVDGRQLVAVALPIPAVGVITPSYLGPGP